MTAAPARTGGGVAPPLWPRMASATLSLLGLLISLYMVLYHYGLIGRLLCGSSGSCEVVQASRYAVIAGIPVALVGLAGYLVLLLLSLAGLQPSLAGDRRISVALLALASIAALFSGYLSALEAWVIHAWCRWCLGSAAVVALLFLCALADVLFRRGPARSREAP